MPPRRIGPFVRFFDGAFTLDSVRRIEVSLKVEGEDGFVLNGPLLDVARSLATRPTWSSRCSGGTTNIRMARCCSSAPCSRPIEDRGAKGQGFTHKLGDVTTICGAGARHARQPHDALDRGAAVDVRHGRPDAQPRATRPVVGLG